MPSRKEITRWLLEAAKLEERVCKENGMCALPTACAISEWEIRAAQVENMRCDTCEHWLISYEENNDQFCSILDLFTINTFYCSNYKPMED